MLVLCWLIFATVQMYMFYTAPLIPYIQTNLHLDYAEAGLILGSPPLMYVFCIVGGLFADRFGVKRALGISSSIIGFFSVLRGFSFDFVSLFAASMGMSFGIAMTVPNLPKVVKNYFPPEKLGTATGIYVTGSGAGPFLGLNLSYILLALVGRWQMVFQVYGFWGLAVSLLWWVITKKSPTSTSDSEKTKIRVGEALSKVILNRDLWLVSGILFCVNMISYGVIQWLPTILIEGAAIDRATAALAASIFFFGVPASILVPMASDRLGRRKPFLLIPSIITGPAAYLTGTRTDLIFWPSALIFGLCLYGVFSLTYTLPAELVEEKLVGSAAGLVLAVGYLGSFAGPLIVGFLRGVTGTFDTGVLAISVACEIAAILSLALKETYKSKE